MPSLEEAYILQKYADEHSRFMVIDGDLIHYKVEGPADGYPLVLLHGAFSSLHTYDAWVGLLGHKYRIYRFDLVGFGLTGASVHGDYSIRRHLYYLNTFLDRMQIGKCCLVGSSLGGWVSWEYALMRPSRVERLVLIDAAGFLEFNSIPAPFRLARAPFLNRVIRFAISRPMLETYVRQVYANPQKVTQPLIDRYYDLFTRPGTPEAFYAFVRQNFEDHTPQLRLIDCPALILWGREDQWIPSEYGERFHDLLPHNELIIYERTGHLPMEEIPRDTAEDFERFMQEHEQLRSMRRSG